MKLAEMTTYAVAALDRDTPVVLPVAAIEQHGRHLPLATDTLLVGEVARRAEAALGERALFAPCMWLGNSHHHLDFAGTMSAEPRTYLDLLRDLVEPFLTHGFRRVLILNGHGGNIVPGRQAIFELRQKHRARSDLRLVFAAYWALGGKPNEVDGSIRQPRMMHACEWETSMMLALAPHLVGDHAAAEPVEPTLRHEPAHLAWTTKDRSQVGHIGDPRTATAAKGETLFRVFAADVIRLIESMRD